MVNSMITDDPDDDKTRIGSGPPPPKLPDRTPAKGAAKDESDQTKVAALPPPPRIPPAGASPPASSAEPERATVEPPAPQLVEETEEDDDKTFVMPVSRLAARLERMQPAGRSDMIRLDRSSYRVGRSDTCDIRLYSSTASREHAHLSNRDGKWYVSPLAERVVLVDGEPVRAEALLTHKMRVKFGGDELLFLDETAVPQPRAAPVARKWSAFHIAVIALAIAALVAAASWLFMTP